ncbi:hypothetical protein Tco_1519759, partial [Tanacetum coccineum]
MRYTSHHLDRFTSGSSSGHSSSDHSSSRHSISGLHGVARPISVEGLPHYLPCIQLTTSESSAEDSSSKSFAGPSRKRCRSPAVTVTSSIHATRVFVPYRTDLLPPRKRFRNSVSLEGSVEEDINTDVLADIKAYATTDEVAIDRDVEAGVDAGIGMEVDVGVDVEDEVEYEVESSDRGTMESFALRNFDLEVMEFEYVNSNTTAIDKHTSSKAMLAIDGVGFDWSDMGEEQVHTNMALMAFLDSE